MLFSSYFDDSDDNTTNLFGVGGFVGPDHAWGMLEGQWLDLLPDGITYFHASDCFTGNNEFEPARGFGRQRRIDLIDRLTDLICATDIRLFCRAIDVPKYVHFAPKYIENNFLGNKYVACFDYDVQDVCRDYMQPHGEPHAIDTGDVCAIFYEESDYSNSVARHVNAIRNDAALWWHNRVGNATPGTKIGPAGIPLLQVADLGAFLGTKYAGNSPNRNIPWQPYWDKPVGCRENLGSR